MTTVQFALRSDRRVHPVPVAFRALTVAEVRALGETFSRRHAWVIDRNGRAAEVKITSVKTWKRRPLETEVHCQFGLYEFFVEACPGALEAETQFYTREG